MKWRLTRRNIIKKRLIVFAFENISHISLGCKLVPVLYRELESGIFSIFSKWLLKIVNENFYFDLG